MLKLFKEDIKLKQFKKKNFCNYSSMILFVLQQQKLKAWHNPSENFSAPLSNMCNLSPFILDTIICLQKDLWICTHQSFFEDIHTSSLHTLKKCSTLTMKLILWKIVVFSFFRILGSYWSVVIGVWLMGGFVDLQLV